MITILKGDICYSLTKDEIAFHPDSYLIMEDGLIKGIYPQIPTEYSQCKVEDHTGRLIIPGMTDLHIHAPQFNFRGIGMDRELIDWLQTYTFPEESKFADLDYARRSYEIFTNTLRRSATTRLCVFATIHREATLLLMDLLEASGLVSYVGKVNMDRHSSDDYIETTDESIAQTTKWLSETADRGYRRTKPILTPRFIPSCTDELMTALGKLTTKGYALQSHLDENLTEIQMVREMVPESKSYADAYHIRNCFGESSPCIMAHCVHTTPEEIELIKQNGVFIAHSPESNANLASGVAPIAKYLAEGLNVGLATDVAGGSNENMFRAIAIALQCSNLRWRLQDQSTEKLSFANAFYLATKGGGAFFGQVGSFEPGYEADILVVDDSTYETARDLTLKERLERLPYLATSADIVSKYVAGAKLF